MTATIDETAGAPNPTSKSELVPGGRVGKYELQHVLGAGGMGVVWAANDPDLDRVVAIKLLHGVDAAPSLRTRLLREARAMARLKHPNVLTVYEVDTDGDRDYIAMELVDGTNLDIWLSDRPPRAEVVAALLAAGRGLAAAHAAGLVHRDFKPHNVLRGRDGRVLVTDFGLARGIAGEPVKPTSASASNEPLALDETLDASPMPTPRRSDSVLDSPLTQTGALIGTPAYMAPEQYMGAQPDPRTDQFAFCVTAWQALTGERPFTGTTLDELRRAVLAGVTNTKADLPKDVRAALVRGLDPDPAKRWPDLAALLDALERAHRTGAPRLILPLVGIITLGALATIALVTRGHDQVAPACAPAERVFGEAWSAALRDELVRTKPSSGSFERIANKLDAYERTWIASYSAVCQAPTDNQFHAKIDCLRGARDRVEVARFVLRLSNQALSEALDLDAAVPDPRWCTGPHPIVVPMIPEGQPRRTQILATLANVFALRITPLDQLASRSSTLQAEATALAWAPLLAEIDVTTGTAYRRYHQPARARELLRRALASTAESHDVTTEAIARRELLEASLEQLEHPGWFGDKHAKGTLHEELGTLIGEAHTAARAAGDDPLLAGSIALLEAKARLGVGQWGRYPKSNKEMPALLAEARRLFTLAGDARRSALAAVDEASMYLQHGDTAALDDALFVLRAADDALDHAHVGPMPQVVALRARIAFLHSDYREVRRQYDRITTQEPVPPSAISRMGRVIDRTGKPVDGATVVAWTGELIGDPVNVFSDPSQGRGEAVKTGRDGIFSVHAEPGAAVIAVRGSLASAPQSIGDGPVAITLQPAVDLEGTVDGRNTFGAQVFARFVVGTAAWVVRAPIDKDRHTYHLRVPPGGTLGVSGRSGTGMRTLRPTHDNRWTWGLGQNVEVIARGDSVDSNGTVWWFREAVAPTTRAEAEALAATAREVTTSALLPIGADATDNGRDLYEPGDRHAIALGYPETKEITACVSPGGTTMSVTCKRFVVKPGAVMDYSDDRFGADVTSVLFTF